jgi:hypothetical protein
MKFSNQITQNHIDIFLIGRYTSTYTEDKGVPAKEGWTAFVLFYFTGIKGWRQLTFSLPACALTNLPGKGKLT